MEATRIIWLTTLLWLSISAIEFEEQHETTAVPIVSYVTTEQAPEPSAIDNGMTIEVLPEVKVEPPTAPELEPTGIEEPETVLVTFPDNHKNFTSSQQLVEYPSYYHQLNEYQQQYKNYYEQKQLYSGKPIKFEENSQKNYYVPQVTEAPEEEKKPEPVRLNRKPFPYVFENEKTPEDWYTKDIRHVVVKNEPEQNYVVKGHQEHVLPHYVTPYKHYDDYRHYKDEVRYHDHFNHHDQYDLGKEKIDPWKKVFKVLTALVPLGLFLATLTPNVISINSTGTTLNTRQRSVEPNELKFKEEDILRLMKEYGVDSLSEAQCEDRVICELARKGENSSANSIEKGFWYLANETPWNVAEEAGMNDLFKAIKTGTCELFKCHSKTKTAKKNRFGKKLIKRRKVQQAVVQ